MINFPSQNDPGIHQEHIIFIMDKAVPSRSSCMNLWASGLSSRGLDRDQLSNNLLVLATARVYRPIFVSASIQQAQKTSPSSLPPRGILIPSFRREWLAHCILVIGEVLISPVLISAVLVCAVLASVIFISIALVLWASNCWKHSPKIHPGSVALEMTFQVLIGSRHRS